ncbi:MAG: DUF4421 family protein [Bacteroidales bacterium]|nr:DUF4421 family protein [Bacteroidales bacterium]MBN2749997.1 DUF4421 family protein [Bacteroidales bacterium]
MRIVATAFLLLFGWFAQAQQANNALLKLNPLIDSIYVQDFSDKLIIGVYLPHKFLDFAVANTKRSTTELEYEPSSRASIGGCFGYKWFGAGASVSIPQSDKDRAMYGKTTRYDFQFNIYLRKFVVDAYFQSYKGVYNANVDEFIGGWNSDTPFPQRPDIGLVNMGLTARYVWNNTRFSYKSSFDFSEKQRKSAGSLIFGLYAFINGVAADSSVIPHYARSCFDENIMYSSYSGIHLGYSVGYAYTFVIKKNLFFTLSVIPGIGAFASELTLADGSVVYPGAKASIVISSRFSLGYSNNRFYLAINGVNGTTIAEASKAYSTELSYGNANVTLGYRFNAPRLLKQRK